MDTKASEWFVAVEKKFKEFSGSDGVITLQTFHEVFGGQKVGKRDLLMYFSSKAISIVLTG